MQITKSNGTEIRRFMRSIDSAFTSVAEDKTGVTYNMAFSMQLAIPLINKSASEIKSYIEKVQRAVTQFAETDILNVELDIVEHGSVQFHIAAKTKESYEASQKLEEKVVPLVKEG